MASNKALEAQIAKAPDDDSAYEVYADWLLEQGDPRGELASAQLAGNKKLANKLLAKHPALWGGLEAYPGVVTHVTWKAGFIASARIESPWIDLPGGYTEPDKSIPLDDVLGRLLDGAGRFLQELVIGFVPEDRDYKYLVAVIAKRRPKTLRRIWFGDIDESNALLDLIPIGDISKLYAAVPKLESLRLRCGKVKLGKIVLPALRRFTIVTGSLDASGAKAIASAKWPKLEDLEIWCGPTLHWGTLLPIVDGKGLPKLTRLGIRNLTNFSGLLPCLLGGKLLRQLRVLDLSLNTLTGVQVSEQLIPFRQRLTHLDELIVHANCFSSRALNELDKLGIKVTKKADPKGQDLNFAGKKCRYVENVGSNGQRAAGAGAALLTAGEDFGDDDDNYDDAGE